MTEASKLTPEEKDRLLDEWLAERAADQPAKPGLSLPVNARRWLYGGALIAAVVAILWAAGHHSHLIGEGPDAMAAAVLAMALANLGLALQIYVFGWVHSLDEFGELLRAVMRSVRDPEVPIDPKVVSAMRAVAIHAAGFMTYNAIVVFAILYYMRGH